MFHCFRDAVGIFYSPSQLSSKALRKDQVDYLGVVTFKRFVLSYLYS